MKPDISQIMQNFQMDHKTVYYLLRMFIENTSREFEQLNEAITARNLDQIQKTIHKLKSAYAYLLINEATSLCDKIKYTHQSGNDFSSIEPILNEFCELHRLFINNVKNIVDENT